MWSKAELFFFLILFSISFEDLELNNRLNKIVYFEIFFLEFSTRIKKKFWISLQLTLDLNCILMFNNSTPVWKDILLELKELTTRAPTLQIITLGFFMFILKQITLTRLKRTLKKSSALCTFSLKKNIFFFSNKKLCIYNEKMHSSYERETVKRANQKKKLLR